MRFTFTDGSSRGLAKPKRRYYWKFEAGVAPTAVTWTDTIPITMEVPQDTNSYPDIIAMATTTSKKISGIVLPDNLDSTFNAKCICPEDLAGTPAAQVVLYFMPTGAATAGDIQVTLSRLFVNNAESYDQGFTSETEATIGISATAFVQTKATITLAASPTAGEQIEWQVLRQASSDASDTYEANVICTGMTMLIDRTAS